MKTIGWRLKKVLEAKGLKQKELSEKTGIPEMTISDIVNDRRNPGVHNIQLIAETLELDLNWLITGEVIKNKEDGGIGYMLPGRILKVAKENEAYQSKYMPELTELLQQLPVEFRHFILKLAQQLKRELK